MTPEHPVSPQLPATTMSDSSQEAVMIPGPHSKAPQQHRNRYHHRHSSSESNSSSLSALDIINDRLPMGIGTSMSIIPEVASVHIRKKSNCYKGLHSYDSKGSAVESPLIYSTL